MNFVHPRGTVDPWKEIEQTASLSLRLIVALIPDQKLQRIRKTAPSDLLLCSELSLTSVRVWFKTQ